MQNKTFSLKQFYEKRIRRIIPAFYVLLLVSSYLSIVILLPLETVNFFKSLIPSLFYGSNIHFYNQVGYFDHLATSKPLLHTWSLGLEEQFYLFLPLLLVALRKKSARTLNIAILSLFTISFSYSFLYLLEDEAFTFYLLPTRMWELLLGSILALKLIPLIKNDYVDNFLSILGLTLISYSIFSFDDKTSFPGLLALIPTLGTFLILFSNSQRRTVIGKILSLAPIRFIGLTSYSLYLWHWPLIVFYKEYFGSNLNIIDKVIILFFSFLLATLSTYFIENPVRKRKILNTHYKLFLSYLISTLIILFSAIYVIKQGGLPSRFDINYLNITKSLNSENILSEKCYSHDDEQIEESILRLKQENLCEALEKNPKKDIKAKSSFLVWGDSFAQASFSTFTSIAKMNNSKYFFSGVSGCAGLLIADTKIKSDKCSRYNNTVFNKLKNSKIKNVFLVSWWSVIRDKSTILFETNLAYTIKKLKSIGVNVWIIKNAPTYNESIRKLIYRNVNSIGRYTNLQTNQLTFSGLTSKEQQDYHEPLNTFFNKIRNDITFIDFNTFYCPNDKCLIVIDGRSLYRDRSHITDDAAKLLGEFFKNKVKILKDLLYLTAAYLVFNIDQVKSKERSFSTNTMYISCLLREN